MIKFETMKKVIFTGNIPQCPYCEKPTEREELGSSTTLANFPVVYDKNGVDISPRKNINTSGWGCCECKQYYTIKGNTIVGHHYVDTNRTGYFYTND